MSGMLWKKLWLDEKKLKQIEDLLASGYKIDSDGQIKPAHQGGAFKSPWVFFGSCVPTNCGIWNGIYFRRFGLIPSYCRTKCHKVVGNFRNMVELMMVYDLMAFLNQKFNISGKCGCDRRTYTFGPWKSFHYFQSMESGLEGLDIIREEIHKHLGKHIKVILKKGCTEFENPRMGGKPSNEWGDPSPEELELENRLNTMFYQGEEKYVQPDWLKQKIMLSWLAYAYGMGDPTVFEFVDPSFFGVHTLTLEKEEKKEADDTDTKEESGSINPI